jgi:hypothetical protein
VQGKSSSAPAVRDENALPEGNQWRYSEFVSAVESGARWLCVGKLVALMMAF